MRIAPEQEKRMITIIKKIGSPPVASVQVPTEEVDEPGTGMCMFYAASGIDPIRGGVSFSIKPAMAYKAVLHRKDIKGKKLPWAAVVLVQPLATQHEVLAGLAQIANDIAAYGLALGESDGDFLVKKFDVKSGTEVVGPIEEQ